MKRILSLVLAFMMVFGMIPAISFAADAAEYTVAEKIPATLDTSTSVNPWGAPVGKWVPMFGTADGQPNDGTWAAWSADSHYAEIVADGYKDLGALHLKSNVHKNVSVAIKPGLVAGESYTIGLWAKGTSNSGKVLASYSNGDFVIIGASQELGADWTYYEKTFTATTSVFNLMAADWGVTDIYVDNITIKNSAGDDLLAG